MGGNLEESVLLLLVENETFIRFATQEALECGGFAVIATADGEAALALLKETDCRVAGLVTDINLGGEIDGWILARQARDLITEICVVYITGDSAADWPAKGVPNSLVLQKPFADAQVQTAIATLLNDRRSPS